MDFKIEGWFPPAIFFSAITGINYAVCGSNWVEIPSSMTMDDVMKGWICTAKDKPKTKPFIPRKSKKDLIESYFPNTKKNLSSIKPRVFAPKAKHLQPKLF